MKIYHKLFFVFLLSLFVLGFALCLDPSITKENMDTMLHDNELHLANSQDSGSDDVGEQPCPNLLIRSGTKLYLHNTTKPKGPNNPIEFNNMDDYLGYLQEQRKMDIRCPVLFLQEEVNTQGDSVYRMYPGPNDMASGYPITPGPINHEILPTEVMDAARDRLPYNENQYAGFDSHGQHIGEFTNLDEIHHSTAETKISDNPMDPNWGGVEFSRQAVNSGKYDDRIVGKPTMVPKPVEIYK